MLTGASPPPLSLSSCPISLTISSRTPRSASSPPISLESSTCANAVCCCPNPIPPHMLPNAAMAAIVAKTAVIVGNLVFPIVLLKNKREMRNLSFVIDYTRV